MDPKRALPRQYHRGQTTLPLRLEWHWAEPDKLSVQRSSFRSSASKPATLSRKKPRSAPGAGTELPWPRAGGSAVEPPPLQACRVLQAPTSRLELAPTLAFCNAAGFPVERLLERWAFGYRSCPSPRPPGWSSHGAPIPFSQGLRSVFRSFTSWAASDRSQPWIFSSGKNKAGQSCLRGRGEDSVRKRGRARSGKPVAEQMVRDYFQEPELVSFQPWPSQRGPSAFIKGRSSQTSRELTREWPPPAQVWATTPSEQLPTSAGILAPDAWQVI